MELLNKEKMEAELKWAFIDELKNKLAAIQINSKHYSTPFKNEEGVERLNDTRIMCVDKLSQIVSQTSIEEMIKSIGKSYAKDIFQIIMYGDKKNGKHNLAFADSIFKQTDISPWSHKVVYTTDCKIELESELKIYFDIKMEYEKQ